ncbi:N-acetylglucosamine-6-phosphate deacetylase [Tepidibacillus fermentans]|uniref:N-acetylglucosamine-6-phosphate deacetylase n=1 Tax=Tepidibacillus fermentans TaxID=1281767 RepID=A0A4R3KIA7_9BACI|nr:N-acetylglucosamine-6-phosphate deacetylase [Tepidibacillus fermentans]TCS83268.1 N-acetylglucosamine 6-phosphate deacetylase [Tepidibacillus fermentans]
MISKKNRFIIANVTIFEEEAKIEKGYIRVENGKISEICKMDNFQDINGIEVIQFPNEYKLIPGMIDLHIHGAAGADTMDATIEAIETIASALPKEGTTSFLATTITKEEEEIERALINVANYMKKENNAGKAEVLGVHLEGPFISVKRAGAQPPHAITEPDIKRFKQWQTISENQIKLVTLAPEREGGLELTAYLRETGVVASIGHSDAKYDEAVEAIKAGVTHATHLFNGMRGLHHREPGVVGAVLLHDQVKAELIVDGIHVRPEMVKLIFQQKGKEGIVLVTDAMRAKCLGNGVYQLGGQEVFVRDQQATLKDGTLAGSILKMKDSIRNMMEFTDCTLEDIIYMSSTNPAKQLNVFDRKGSIKVGKDADLVVLDENNQVVMTFCRGELAYNREGGKGI